MKTLNMNFIKITTVYYNEKLNKTVLGREIFLNANKIESFYETTVWNPDVNVGTVFYIKTEDESFNAISDVLWKLKYES